MTTAPRRASWMPPAALLVMSLGLATPVPVAAHAELLIASPAPGTGLPQPPSSVVIKFSEPLDLGLSRIEVLDAGGSDVASGQTVEVPGDPYAMQRSVGNLPIGRYQVQWTSVSRVDGHVLRGSYGFAIGTTAEPGSSVRESPLDTEGWLGLVGRFAMLLGLALWAGSALLSATAGRFGVAQGNLRRLAIGAPISAALGGLLSLVSSALTTTGSLAGFGLVLGSGSGGLRLAGILIAGAGAVLAYLRTPGPHVKSRRNVVGAIAFGGLAAAAIAVEVASGHAAGTQPTAVAIGSLAVHLAAVGIWTFAILAGLLAGRKISEALSAFTPWALGAAAVTALTGAVNAILSVGELGQLLDTGYGITLIAKTVAFAAMAALGATHWLLRRRLRSGRVGGRPLRVPARGEAIAAVLAVALATLLVGFPNPPRAASAAQHFVTIDPVLGQLAGRQAASVAEASGPFVVGLTILPPRPGPVEMRVQVLGVQAGDGLRNANVLATSPAGVASQLRLAPCGLGCFAGTGSLTGDGTWTFGVRIGSNRGAIALDLRLPLPTADGLSVFRRAVTAMASLRSARLLETLGSTVGGPRIRSAYAFQAPNAMHLVVGNSTRVIIGSTEWVQSGRDAPWTKSEWPGTAFTWPSGYFTAFWGEPVAVRVIGEGAVDGHPSTIIAFLRPDLPAWFRLWVGDDGLVRRQQMRAEAHLMDHMLTDLNAPIEITPPR
jgi:copper transport protein